MKPLHIKISIAIFVVLFFSMLYIFLRPKNAKADSFVLSATDCSGGFNNPELAEGNQNVLSSQISKFNTSNSAVLPSGVQAELKCKKFDGEIIDGAIPQKITAKFSWAATYDSKLNEAIPEEKTIDNGPAVIPPTENTSSSTEVNNVSDMPESSVQEDAAPKTVEVKQDVPNNIEVPPAPEEKIEAPTPVPSSAPAPAASPSSDPVSFLDSFINTAFAEETVSSTVPEIIPAPVAENKEPIKIEEIQKITESSSTENELKDVASTSLLDKLASTSVEQKTSGIVEVLYSLDGTSTKSLGFVSADEFDTTSFDIPVAENMKWDDVKNISIYIRSVSTTDNVTPIVYVDSVMLDVEYSVIGEEVHPYPTVDRGDIFNGEASYENYTAFLVSRPISKRATTTIKISNDILIGTSTASSTLQIPTKEEIWISDNNASSTDRWMFVVGDKTIDKNTKVFFRYGYLFWIGNKNTLWVFNPKSQSFSSASIEIDKPTQYLFNDESGGNKVMIISQPGNIVAFEDYIKSVE